MDASRFRLCLALATLLTALGCANAGGPWGFAQHGEPVPPQGTPRPEGALASNSDRGSEAVPYDRRAGSKLAPPEEPSAAAAASPPKPDLDPNALANIIAELQTLGAIDPDVQNQLMDDLKRTDPALWPALMQSFRATLAYQRRARGVAPPVPAEISPHPTPLSPPRLSEMDVVSKVHRDPQAVSFASVPSSTTAQPGARFAAVASESTGDPQALAAPVQPTSSNAPNQSIAQPAQPNGVVQAVAQQTVGDASGTEPSGVTQASHDQPVALSPVPVDWRGNLTAAIANLESETNDAPDSPEALARQARLRMLYLVAGRREDAMRPISGADPVQQEFWSKEIYGLATLLDAARNPDPAARAAEAAVHLNQATGTLSELGSLVVRNLTFCTEVRSYGVFERFEEYEFRPGQETLLYAEVENFKSESTPQGYHTSLKSSYMVFDSQGRRVDDHEFAVTEEYCRNRRRDFFIRYYLRMPERVYDGQYTLQLTIEDTLSRKVGQSSVEFTIKEK